LAQGLAMASRVRRATHAGTWYSESAAKLSSELNGWLQAAAASSSPQPDRTAQVIIAPHAGFSYSGPTAAYAYSSVDACRVRRIFLLGPSHHVYLEGCSVSATSHYETPLGSLEVDRGLTDELLATGAFEVMSQKVDEDEHSLEMHLPYIVHILAEGDPAAGFTLVPVLVGSLSESSKSKYGGIFAKYLSDPENLFVVSSDFCHWGSRFRFQHYDKSKGEIYQSIEALDRTGMGLIENTDARGFAEYLKQYGNTICGRHPISILLYSILALGERGFPSELRFVQYAQSSQVQSMADSSVSYASAVLVPVQEGQQ